MTHPHDFDPDDTATPFHFVHEGQHFVAGQVTLNGKPIRTRMLYVDGQLHVENLDHVDQVEPEGGWIVPRFTELGP